MFIFDTYHDFISRQLNLRFSCLFLVHHIRRIGYELSQAWKSSIERTLVYSADKKGLGFFVGHNTSNQDPDLIWHTLGISKRGGKSIDPIYDTYYHLLP